MNLGELITAYFRKYQKQFIEEDFCIFLIAQICEAFKSLSQNNVMHRDLKP
jgi:serine/threonine protein kinase